MPSFGTKGMKKQYCWEKLIMQMAKDNFSIIQSKLTD